MIIDSINLNHLRIFECVFRTGSMTTAAQELHLTQSGISQHIRSLEDVLGIRLFDRIKRRLIPTSTAHILFKRCAESLHGIEQTLSDIKGGEVSLSGTVYIGMPMEFGNNIILPLLSKIGKLHPKIKFSVRYGLATQMNVDLLEGDLDFAFVDGFGIDKRITTEIVYHEDLLLCANEELLKKKGKARETRKYFESLEYVDYQAGEPILRMWFGHHLGSRSLNLNIRATVMNVQGVARMILNGLAAGVLPGHLAYKLEKEGNHLHYFKGCGNPLKNRISIAYVKERTQSLASLHIMQTLLSQLQSQSSGTQRMTKLQEN
jgi:DNA-binding transcriptional LysR family regulator